MADYLSTLRDLRRRLLARFSIAAVVLRVGGTGSGGLRNDLVLLRGNGDEAVTLQVKQARTSVIRQYVDQPPIRHEREQVVHGARLVQTETDLLPGWTTINGLPFIVKQARNVSGVIDTTSLTDDRLDDYARLAGALLAQAHSGSIDPRVLAGYSGVSEERVDAAIAAYAVAYADQTEADHVAFVHAVRDGRVPATEARVEGIVQDRPNTGAGRAEEPPGQFSFLRPDRPLEYPSCEDPRPEPPRPSREVRSLAFRERNWPYATGRCSTGLLK